jgi:phosphoenolpyruvate carboxykinase (GTP)
MAAATKSPASTRVLTTNKHLIRWVEKMAELTQPAAIHWIDGSEAENEYLCTQLVEAGPPTTGKTPSSCGRSSKRSSAAA